MADGIDCEYASGHNLDCPHTGQHWCIDCMTRERAQLAAAEKCAPCLIAYVLEFGGLHVDGCPEDDTCGCVFVAQTNEALAAYNEAKK